MTDDTAGTLDLRCPRRAIVFYLVTGVPVVGLFATFFIAGWNDTREQTVLLSVLLLCFAGLSIQGLQQRCRLSRGAFQKRILGVWRSTIVPPNVHFQPVPDLNGNAALARRWLAAPPGIAIVDSSSGRRIGEIGCDMLAGMTTEAYESLLKDLNGGRRTRG